MLGQRRRRWPSIKPTLVQCLLFAGYARSSSLPVTGSSSTQLDTDVTLCWRPQGIQHKANAGTMLVRCHRRRPSIVSAFARQQPVHQICSSVTEPHARQFTSPTSTCSTFESLHAQSRLITELVSSIVPLNWNLVIYSHRCVVLVRQRHV